jgi:hypothetical protein
MEVHHHPHVEKKNFKEYFLEFLMIFLAVTMGFFAENIRENFTEKKQLHEYMDQMVENLKADTLRYSQALHSNVTSFAFLDSLRHQITEAASGRQNVRLLYYYYVSFGNRGFSEVLVKDAAMVQMKSSGTIRLIENKNLTGQILEYYDRWAIALKIYQEQSEDLLKICDQNCNQFFDSQYFDYLISHEPSTSFYVDTAILSHIEEIKQTSQPLELLNTNSIDLKKLNNTISDLEKGIYSNQIFIKHNKKFAESLISSIRKEYDLKNE